jgi:hypothetical protein
LKATGIGAYLWSTTDTATTILVTPTDPSVYTVTVTSSNGCTGTSSISVNVKSLPSTPDALQNGNVLASSASTGNQWYLNGNIIPGATKQFYTPAQSGFYTVIVTVNGCSVGSAPIDFTSSGIGAIAYINSANIYPNPSNGNVFIDFGSGSSDKLVLTVVNVLGQTVLSEVIPKGTTLFSIDLSSERTGVYSLMLQSNSGTRAQKVIVSR